MNRVLVTGGCGYVGTVLVPVLLQRGWGVRVYDPMLFGNALAGQKDVEFFQGDIRDAAAVREAVQDCTYVIHLAGVVTDELAAMNPARAREVNVTAMETLVRAARLAGVRRFVYASSSSVYGFRDEPATEADAPHPMSAYAESKLEGERTLRAYAGPMEWAILRSATCCGPAPRMRLDTIVNAMCAGAWFKRKVTVHGGAQWRSNVHVQDAAECYEWLLTAPIVEQTFNLTAENHTAREIGTMVKAYFTQSYRRECELFIDLSKPDSRHYKMSAAKLAGAGFRPGRSILHAIQDNMEWFAAGKVANPDDDLFHNTRRMKEFMTA